MGLLRLIVGRAGSGKSSLCRREIAGRLQSDPAGPPLIYIVPEQAAFQAEYSLATTPGLGGMIRAQVLGFRRLAWKVLQESGGGRRRYIDDTGKAMLMRRVLEEQGAELQVFGRAAGQRGLLENLVNFYNEMKRSRLSAEQLQGYLQSSDELPLLTRAKVRDLALITARMQQLAASFVDAEDCLDMLAARIGCSEYLAEAEVWVDGFYGFTGQEYSVLEQLLHRCRQVSIALCLDRPRAAGEQVDELDPFYPTAATCSRLRQIAARLGAPVQVVETPGGGGGVPPRFAASPVLARLESGLYRYPARSEPVDTGRALRLLAATNRRSEVEGLAREIIRLARDEGCRWREMAVIAGNLDDYRPIIAPLFEEYGIPFFIDQKRPVLSHPLVIFLRSALEVITGNWRYDAVFNCLKTELLLPLPQGGGGDAPADRSEGYWRERVDRLENYVLAWGLEGAARWLQDEPWSYRARRLDDHEEQVPPAEERAQLQEIDETRRLLARPLAALQAALRAAETVAGQTAALRSLLEEVAAAERLQAWSEAALALGEAKRAREHLQVFRGVHELLDQLDEILGAQRLGVAALRRVLDAGLENLRLGLVPPALDQVLVGDVRRTRSGRVRYAFLLGINEGVIPTRHPEDGLLSEEEREALLAAGLELAPGSRRRLLDEQFFIYVALTLPSSGLWLSYPLADEEGRALAPSLLVARIRELFPSLQEQLLDEEPAAPQENVVRPGPALARLGAQLSRRRRGEPAPLWWWDVYNWFAGCAAWRPRLRALTGGLFYNNLEPGLDARTSLQLYGPRLQVSVSGIEKYRSCPFAYFVASGLRLRERRLFRLEAPDIGQFFHVALRNIALALEARGLDWGELSSEQCLELAQAEVEKLIPRLQEEILLSSGRYRFLAGRLRQAVGLAAVHLGEHARAGRFAPLAVELSFGRRGQLPPLSLALDGGREVELAGRIDRVDGARSADGRHYLRVIDYKTGGADLKLVEVYHGLALQLFAYLDVVLTHAPRWLGARALPAGVFYYRISAPPVRSEVPLDAAAARRQRQRQFRLQGRALADQQAVYLMDAGLRAAGRSLLVPVAIRQDGGFAAGSSVLRLEQFAAIRRRVRRLIKEAAERIVGGAMPISPCRLADRVACAFCAYRCVCQFDPLIAGNNYRRLPAASDAQVLAWLPEGEAGEEGEANDE